jgi:hypothetical protein
VRGRDLATRYPITAVARRVTHRCWLAGPRRASGGAPRVSYAQLVETPKWWMNLLAPIARPGFTVAERHDQVRKPPGPLCREVELVPQHIAGGDRIPFAIRAGEGLVGPTGTTEPRQHSPPSDASQCGSHAPKGAPDAPLLRLRRWHPHRVVEPWSVPCPPRPVSHCLGDGPDRSSSRRTVQPVKP